MQEIEEENSINRLQKTNYYRGLIYTRIEDRGPDVIFNLTNLDESQALALSVQSFTIIGVGTGSRSSGSWIGHLFGPMPVPTGQLMNSLIFPFVIEDKTSKDLRVIKSGRSCALIFLVRAIDSLTCS